jgi:ADP-ribosyl-[dinitrogen reductase] hydrolase
MLLESAVGDAYGGGFEYVSPEIVREFGGKLEYRAHPKHKQITPGKYTDDTQMSLAIAEAMLQDDPWTIETLAQRFIDVFKRDERTGYSRKFYAVLKEVANGPELLAKLLPTSDRSGAAMRAYPIGLYKGTKEVIERSTIQARITHNTPLGISAAVASALMTHFFVRNLGSKSELGAFLEFYSDDDLAWSKPYAEKVGEKGWMSVMAAITAITSSASMTEVLKASIAFTGDVDTVAAIALGAASLSGEIVQDLPDHLLSGLENNAYGKDYISNLDERLFEKFEVRPPLAISQSGSTQLLQRFDAL